MADVYVNIPEEWTSLTALESFNSKDESQGALAVVAGKEYVIEISAGVSNGTPGVYIYQGDKPLEDSVALGSSFTVYDGQATIGIGVSDTWVKRYNASTDTKLNILGV